MIVNREAIIARATAERRNHLRLQVDLSGKFFVPAEQREEPCRIVDLSPSGARVAAEFVPPTGSHVVLYIDEFGRFECDVVRSEWGHFGVVFRCSSLKQARLAEQLEIIAKQGAPQPATLRRHDRRAGGELSQFTRSNGEAVHCEVLDLSLSGLSLKTTVRPPVGEIITIGQVSGRVVRHHESGIAVEFCGQRKGERPYLRSLR
ncbi:MAG TPA: PilZ domain-containing protein [Rhizomicrobium sp.]|jgi:c-di-GMP-binding flagellar brake protein YcgR|nr:PilZ domain-containing protein [Rhizomicrobium sp.]